MTPTMIAHHPATRSRLITKLVAFTPLGLLLITAMGSSAFSVVFSKPPELGGMPLGLILEAMAMLWMLGGVAVIWRAASPLAESLALMLFTIPSTVAVVFAPAAIGVMQALG